MLLLPSASQFSGQLALAGNDVLQDSGLIRVLTNLNSHFI